MPQRQHVTNEPLTHSVQHANDEFGVSEGTDFLEALAVDDGQRLQTQALHRNFGRQQESMVEFIKKLITEWKDTGEKNENDCCCYHQLVLMNFASYDLLMALDSSFSSSSSSRRR